MSPNRPYAKVVSHGRYVAIPRNCSPTSCGWSPNYDHRPLHSQRKAFRDNSSLKWAAIWGMPLKLGVSLVAERW
jgi:hypothetical protein